jgi:O-Antigen ligase
MYLTHSVTLLAGIASGLGGFWGFVPWTWLFCWLGIVGLMFLVGYTNGPRRALIFGILLSLIVPEWIRWEITSTLWVNMRVAVSVSGLIMYLLHPHSTYNFKLSWCDFAGMGLLATHILSDSINSGVSISIPLRAYGEWVLPYMAGRVAIQEVGDARWALPTAMFVTVVLVALGAMESAISLVIPYESLNPNMFEQLAMQQRPFDEHAPYYMQRFGMKRAYGPTQHPMYYGSLVFLLFPWCLYAASRAANPKANAPSWWRIMPWLCGIGVCCSISRAPILAIPVAVYCIWFISKPTWRIPLAIVGVVVAVVGFFTQDAIQTAMETISREQNTNRKVKIHNQEYRFTGTTHRWLMFVAYGPAIKQTGLVGFGTERTSEFPPNVPAKNGIPTEMFSVDNAYLLILLRFGYFGVLFFVAMLCAAQWNFWEMLQNPKAEGSAWAAAMLGSLIAFGLLMLTVWLPQDFGFFYIVNIGAAAGLWAERLQPHLPAMEERIRQEKKHGSGSGRRRRRRRSSSEESENQADNGGGDYSDYASAEPEKGHDTAEFGSEEHKSQRRRRRRSHRSHDEDAS